MKVKIIKHYNKNTKIWRIHLASLQVTPFLFGYHLFDETPNSSLQYFCIAFAKFQIWYIDNYWQKINLMILWKKTSKWICQFFNNSKNITIQQQKLVFRWNSTNKDVELLSPWNLFTTKVSMVIVSKTKRLR